MRAQTLSTADRNAEVSAFAGFSYVKQDYSSSVIPHSLGWTLGGDLDLRPLWGLFSPGLEMRVARSSGTGPNAGAEALTDYAGGFRVQMHLGRLQPYAGLLFGYGTLRYSQPDVTPRGTFPGDNAYTWNEVVGADYQMTRHWGLRVDWMEQYWNTDSISFAPWALTVGARYRIFVGGPRTR
jgi:hypothetical protein